MKKKNDTIHSAKDTVNVLLDEIGGAEDEEEFDYIQIDQLNSSNQDVLSLLDPKQPYSGTGQTASFLSRSPMKKNDSLQLSKISGGKVNEPGGTGLHSSGGDFLENPNSDNDDDLNEADEETLNEIERRQNEILEQFLEKALTKKEEARENLIK